MRTIGAALTAAIALTGCAGSGAFNSGFSTLLVPALVIGGVIATYAVIKAAWTAERATEEKDRVDAKAPGTLRDTFTGAKDVVTIDTRLPSNPRPGIVVSQALRYGYSLIHDDEGLLTFKKDQPV